MEAAGAAGEAQAERFAAGGALGPGEALADGFWAEFRGEPPEEAGGRGEALLVDRQEDVCLRHWAEEVARATQLGSSVEERATMLALLVAERMGGVAWGEGELEQRFLADYEQVRREYRDERVRLGSLAVGLERHRALAFKVLAEAAQVPCCLFGESAGASAGISVIDERGEERGIELVGDVGSWKVRPHSPPKRPAETGEVTESTFAAAARTRPVSRSEPYRGLDTFLEEDADAARIREALKVAPEKYYEGLGRGGVAGPEDSEEPGPRPRPHLSPSRRHVRENRRDQAGVFERSRAHASPLARRTGRNATLRAEKEVEEARQRAVAEEIFERKLKSLYEDGVEPKYQSEVARLMQRHHDVSADEAEGALHIVGGDEEKASDVCAMAGTAHCAIRDAAAWLQFNAWNLEEAVRAYRGHAMGSRQQPLHTSSGFNSQSSSHTEGRRHVNVCKGKAGNRPPPAKMGGNSGATPVANPFYRYMEPNGRDHPLNRAQAETAPAQWDSGYSTMAGVWKAEMEQRRAASQQQPAKHGESRPLRDSWGLGGQSPMGAARHRSNQSSKREEDYRGGRMHPERTAAEATVPKTHSSDVASKKTAEQLRDAAVSAIQHQTTGKNLTEIFTMFGVPVEGGDLRKAYRKAGMLLHPDRNRGKPVHLRIEAEEKWKLLGAKMNR